MNTVTQALQEPLTAISYTQDVPRVAQAQTEPWVLVNAGTIGMKASRAACVKTVMELLPSLEPDKYMRFLLKYYEAGLSGLGDDWVYADILTVLLTTSRLIQPARYLEIGVRRGRSMAMVATSCPECDIVGFDAWQENYGGCPNPGPDFVKSQLNNIGHRGALELISGDSHQTVPAYLRDNPDSYFDLITVDGDHSYDGALQDLTNVLPRLKIGGVIIFDDIAHPAHTNLLELWQTLVADDPRFSSWVFDELGCGVALAVRKW